MNWLIFLQIGQWLTSPTLPPKLYWWSDEAFFAQSTSHQPIALNKPDRLLLDAALFQATNEARRLAGLTPLQYDQALYQAAQSHAESMVLYDYIDHEDVHQLAERTLLRRVEKRTSRFGRMAENIGQYQTINTAEWYSVRFDQDRQRYEYIDPETKRGYQPYSYAAYARYAVQQWLHSPHHRANLLNPAFTYVGCAGELSLHPFQQRHAPFGRLVQDFGTPRVVAQASR